MMMKVKSHKRDNVTSMKSREFRSNGCLHWLYAFRRLAYGSFNLIWGFSFVQLILSTNPMKNSTNNCTVCVCVCSQLGDYFSFTKSIGFIWVSFGCLKMLSCVCVIYRWHSPPCPQARLTCHCICFNSVLYNRKCVFVFVVCALP